MVGEKMKRVPLEVSPLIKLARWSCLVAGLIHGFNSQRNYAALEDSQREHRERLKIAREEHLAREKHRQNAVEMKELEKIFLGTVPIDEEANQVTTDTREVKEATVEEE